LDIAGTRELKTDGEMYHPWVSTVVWYCSTDMGGVFYGCQPRRTGDSLSGSETCVFSDRRYYCWPCR